MSLIKITDSQLIELNDDTYAYKLSCTGKQSDALNLEPNKSQIRIIGLHKKMKI